jgi:hypothetical protein
MGRHRALASDEFPRGTAEAIGHRHDQAFLHRHHVGQLRMVHQSVHDRQFGGPWIAEQMRNPFILQQGQEG